MVVEYQSPNCSLQLMSTKFHATIFYFYLSMCPNVGWFFCFDKEISGVKQNCPWLFGWQSTFAYSWKYIGDVFNFFFKFNYLTLQELITKKITDDFGAFKVIENWKNGKPKTTGYIAI